MSVGLKHDRGSNALKLWLAERYLNLITGLPKGSFPLTVISAAQIVVMRGKLSGQLPYYG